MEKADIDVVYRNALKKLHKKYPDHPIFKFKLDRQIEFMDLLRDGQGYYIQEGIKDKLPEIVIPLIGTFQYNPLRAIAEKVKAEYKNKLYPDEITELIKEKLAIFFDNNPNPFVTTRAKPRTFSFTDNSKDEII